MPPSVQKSSSGAPTEKKYRAHPPGRCGSWQAFQRDPTRTVSVSEEEWPDRISRGEDGPSGLAAIGGLVAGFEEPDRPRVRAVEQYLSGAHLFGQVVDNVTKTSAKRGQAEPFAPARHETIHEP